MRHAAINSLHQPMVEGSDPAAIDSIKRVNKNNHIKIFSTVAAGSSVIKPYLIFKYKYCFFLYQSSMTALDIHFGKKRAGLMNESSGIKLASSA